MDGYCLVGEVQNTKQILHAMVQTGVNPNVRSYTIMINGLCKSKRMDEAMNLLRGNTPSPSQSKKKLFYSLVFHLLLTVKNKVNIQMNCNIYIQLSRK